MIRSISGVWLLVLWIGLSGCSGKGDGKNPDEKAAGRSSVAVEVTKVIVEDVTEGIDVVGSLYLKFEAEVKYEY